MTDKRIPHTDLARLLDSLRARGAVYAPARDQAGDVALAEAPLMTIPTLVMQAGDDRLVNPDATRTWVASAPDGLVDYIEWEGYYHELFNEPLFDRRKVFEKMEQWLESH